LCDTERRPQIVDEQVQCLVRLFGATRCWHTS
jgi:hypothetical protein